MDLSSHKIELYTRKTCSLCDQARKYLQERNIQYTEYVIDVDIPRDEVLEKFVGARILPVVVLDDVWIGGRDELLRFVARCESEGRHSSNDFRNAS